MATFVAKLKSSGRIKKYVCWSLIDNPRNLFRYQTPVSLPKKFMQPTLWTEPLLLLFKQKMTCRISNFLRLQ